jgi:hypothetical protein
MTKHNHNLEEIRDLIIVHLVKGYILHRFLDKTKGCFS